MLKTNIFFRLTAILLLLFILFPILVSAQTVNTAYGSDEYLQKGMLVTEKSDDPNKVVALTKESLDKLKGVVVEKNDSPVTLSSTDKNIYVANQGEYEVLVSDENGSISSGDYISISSLAGIGMKANETQEVVVGRASSDFNASSNSIGSTTLSDNKINFGRINVVVEIGRNPNKKDPKANSIPKLLERVSVSIAGKQVPTSRIWLAAAVFLGTMVVTGVMLYSGARGSLISVGRNPLSKKAILRGLLQIVILSLSVFITGIFGVYLLLKL